MNAIETRHLSRSFGKRLAVDSVSIDVPQGTVLGLLGPNGAGKSTLLKLLVGHLRPTAGTVTVLGSTVSSRHRAPWARLGYVSQGRYLPPWMTAADCCRFAAALRSQVWDQAKAARLAGRLEVPLDVPNRNLSRGSYVRLQIVLALAHHPDLILLDEPTSGLDPVGRRELLSILIDEIGAEGRTVVFSSHLVEDVERMADRVAIMDGGRIVACGPVEEVRRGPASLEESFLTYLHRRSEC